MAEGKGDFLILTKKKGLSGDVARPYAQLIRSNTASGVLTREEVTDILVSSGIWKSDARRILSRLLKDRYLKPYK